MDTSLAFAFDYMLFDELCSTVLVYQDETVKVIDYSDKWVKLPFGTWGDKADINDVHKLFETRCFPKTRANCRQILKSGGLQFHNPFEICLKTQGRMTDDGFWMKFYTSLDEIDHEL